MSSYRIPFTGGFSALVDPDVYERLNRFTYYADTKGYGYRWSDDKSHRIFLHREVMEANPDQWVCFFKEDPSDCRRENLFVCSRGEKRTIYRQLVAQKAQAAALETSGGERKTIRLTDGSEVVVDADLHSLFIDRIWHRYNGYACTILPNGRQRFLHREVLDYPKGLYIGFLDEDKLNCRRSNLFTFIPGTKQATLDKILAARKSLLGDLS